MFRPLTSPGLHVSDDLQPGRLGYPHLVWLLTPLLKWQSGKSFDQRTFFLICEEIPNQILWITKYLDLRLISDLFKKKLFQIRQLIPKLRLSKSGSNFLEIVQTHPMGCLQKVLQPTFLIHTGRFALFTSLPHFKMSANCHSVSPKYRNINVSKI